MVERSFTLANESGLHARPASLFVQTVNKFPGHEVTVGKDGKEVNGRSLLSLLSLGASGGATITVRVSGEQEADLMAALAALIEAD